MVRLLSTPKDMLLIHTTISSPSWNFDQPHEKGFTDDDQPHMVRLAWALETPLGGPIGRSCCLVSLPDGQEMSEYWQETIGLYNSQLYRAGLPLADVLEEFFEALKASGTIVAHNWRLHRLVLERSMRLCGVSHERWNHKIRDMQTEGETLTGHKAPNFHQISKVATEGNVPDVALDPRTEGDRQIDRLSAFFRLVDR